MSRSIGDLVASSVGVICDPGICQYLILEIIEKTINEDSRYIVIASDGVWEFLSNPQVVSIVNPYYLKNDPEGACDALIREATECWKKVY